MPDVIRVRQVRQNDTPVYRDGRQSEKSSQCGERLIVIAEDIIRLFLFAAVTQQSFAIVVILDAGEGTAGTAEVHQYPGSDALQKRNLLEHGDLVVVDVGGWWP
jgi:hypothetical protein